MTGARRVSGSPGLAAVAIACAALAAGVCAPDAAGLVRASVRGVDAPDAGADARGAGIDARLDAMVAQVDGRSPFFVPAPPPPPPAIARSTIPGDDAPPPQPARYAGPALVALIGAEAWFADGRRLSAGAPEDDGLALLALDPPWSATVRWRGAEFTIGLFERDAVVLAGDAPATGAAPPLNLGLAREVP
jgi:hypothetical protein